MDPKPLKYDMVSIYERQILTRRPIKKSSVNGILKASLRNFLQGNNLAVPLASTNKSVLVDMVIDLINSEDPTVPKLPAPKIDNMNQLEQHLPTPTGKASTNVPGFTGGSEQTNENTPPAAPNMWDDAADDLVWEDLDDSFDVIETSTPANAATANAATVIEPVVVLEPCNAIYIAQEYQTFYDQDWDMPPACGCQITLNDLTRHLYLPESSMELLGNMIKGTVEELINFLSMYGEQNSGSGCRIQLLMQLRDLLEGEANVNPSNNAPAAASSSSAAAPHGVACALHDKNRKRKLESAGVSSTVLVTDKKGKMSFPSTGFTTATTSVANVAVKRNLPAALGAPINTDTKVKQAQESQKLSKEFNKMMAQQLSLTWGQPGKAQPTASTSVVTAAVSTPAPQQATAVNVSPQKDPEKECCICILNDRSIAFIPCGHAVCCVDCAPKLKDCPVCRRKIKTRLTLFFS